MQSITLGIGDHKHLAVKAGEQVEVVISVPPVSDRAGRKRTFLARFETFDAAGDARTTVSLDGGPSQIVPSNFGSIQWTGLAVGEHRLIVSSDKDDDSLGFWYSGGGIAA